MTINSENLVSITEANRNFSKVARLVDKSGTAVILKNNTPRYVVLDFARLGNDEAVSLGDVLSVARSILEKHLPAFQELAK
ncbi:MAG: type II toxin-antitoxin system Phd/YefM family antitoxin [Dysgonamonadaceae bacterium]|jgi:antitoxin Phd|nr:type II toxin-antitoxin system Phd/YefM family antitoxin [Dysgonamonadaceae bacterium]